MTPELTDNLTALRDYLGALPSGPLDQDRVPEAISLLMDCWDDLPGAKAERTLTYKVARAEQLVWQPPRLHFLLERHGGTVMGSIHAELHHWTVNIDSGEATCSPAGTRRLEAADKPMNAGEVATRIADAIANGTDCPELEWREPGQYALLNIAEIVTATNQKTIGARRKRFRAAIKEVMAKRGWRSDDKGNRMGFRRTPATG